MAEENDGSRQKLNPLPGVRGREQAQELRRLQSSLREISSLLDAIEGRPHHLLRTSAERLTATRAKNVVEPLTEYTQRFAATLAKAQASIEDVKCENLPQSAIEDL